jgi:hypothetical protein
MIGSKDNVPISDAFLFGDDIEIDENLILKNSAHRKQKINIDLSQSLSGKNSSCIMKKSANYL